MFARLAARQTSGDLVTMGVGPLAHHVRDAARVTILPTPEGDWEVTAPPGGRGLTGLTLRADRRGMRARINARIHAGMRAVTRARTQRGSEEEGRDGKEKEKEKETDRRLLALASRSVSEATPNTRAPGTIRYDEPDLERAAA